MVINAVIFDLDGTLANFNLNYKSLRADVRSYLSNHGMPASELSITETIFEMLQKAEIYFKNQGKKTIEFQAIQNEALAIAEKYELEAASTTSLISGAIETLKNLRKMNIKIALCTISGEKASNLILQKFKISEYFDVVVARNKVKRVKPNPEQFMTALEALGTRPETTLIVGDSKIDMQSAKEIKAIAVGYPTGTSAKQLTVNGANYIITALTDLPILVEKLNKEE